jgi:hypothetical protein
LQCTTLAIEPVCFNLTMVRGTDNQLEITITDGDGRALAIGADTIDFVVKDQPGGSIMFSKSNGPGDHSNPDLGQTIFNIDAADTSAASATAVTYWVYEISRTTGGGETRVHIIGDFTVRPRI